MAPHAPAPGEKKLHPVVSALIGKLSTCKNALLNLEISSLYDLFRA